MSHKHKQTSAQLRGVRQGDSLIPPLSTTSFVSILLLLCKNIPFSTVHLIFFWGGGDSSWQNYIYFLSPEKARSTLPNSAAVLKLVPYEKKHSWMVVDSSETTFARPEIEHLDIPRNRFGSVFTDVEHISFSYFSTSEIGCLYFWQVHKWLPRTFPRYFCCVQTRNSFPSFKSLRDSKRFRLAVLYKLFYF